MSTRLGLGEDNAAAVFEFSENGITDPIFALTEDEERWVRIFRWINPDRMVFSLAFRSRRGTVDTVESRLFALDPRERKQERLFSQKKGDYPTQFEDNIVSWLSNDPKGIAVSYRRSQSTDYPGVYYVRADERKLHKTLQRSMKGIYNWSVDNKGIVRAGSGFNDPSTETSRRLIVRTGTEDKWRDISHRVAQGAPDFRIFGFSSDPNIAYAISGHEFDVPGLYEYDIRRDNFRNLIFHDRNREISTLFLDRDTGAVRGVGAAESDPIWLDEEIRVEIKRMQITFPGKQVRLVRESIDKDFAIYDISSPTEPSRYHIRNRQTDKVFVLPSNYPELSNQQLAFVTPIKYTARDGLEINGYVTLPAGTESLAQTANQPFVLLPHGGPTARDFLRFDYWAQFLASRGYGVLQMNFRGSTGYGQSFERAGNKEWGQSMQDDITDGANWLVENGYADANRLAILGGSYGGYAALMGAVKTPDLYQCAVSFAGVTDLPARLKRIRAYIGGRAAEQYIGNLWTDRDKLRENSPALQADKITKPILLIHGEDDRIVDVNQSRKMRGALKRRNKDFKYIELPNGSHGLRTYKNRLTFLKETEAFLSDCLDG
ncbi:MAG: S9 family peptidase [Pseudomonadota bacterium]